MLQTRIDVVGRLRKFVRLASHRLLSRFRLGDLADEVAYHHVWKLFANLDYRRLLCEEHVVHASLFA